MSVTTVTDREAQAIDERRAKADRLRAHGENPYPHEYLDRTLIASLHAAHDPRALGPGEHPGLPHRIAGRVVAKRGHGKTQFIDVRDVSGWIQVLARSEEGQAELFARVEELDVGDLVGFDGHIYVTPRGQLSLAARGVTLLAKALRPPAAKYHGLEDIETRYRRRELDLIANEATRELFVTRARTIAALREWMNDHDFIEIETPVLQTLAGGANARPFVTHHNALDRDLSLTISGEFHLKRCVVGGLERVYMLDKCFRNEGISYKHSPEFTLLEWEMSYADYHDVHDYMEALIAGVAQRVLGTTVIEQHDGLMLDLTPPWPRIKVRDAIRERVGLDIDRAPRAELIEALSDRADSGAGGGGAGDGGAGGGSGSANGRVPDHITWGQLVEALYSKLVEPEIVQPTIFYDFPVEFHPVVKRHRERPELIEHFEVVMRGIEVGSGSTELNDPDEQRRRFVEQRNRRPLDEGEEPYPADEEFVRAMEHGMPPLGGAGIGVDRLLAIFTGSETLREVIPFPALRDPR
ncbi:MAG TPA: lysine--tRNA ligase [Solirubrobacteraceae bacterium]|nr:lysine--tRNA ligase [Solirubrobacteraceae bacterium]